MWKGITDIVATAASFLQSGKVPPNTPQKYAKRLADVNHLASKKFYMTMISVIVLAVFYSVSVLMLMWFSPDATSHISAFTTMFSKTFEILGIIIAVYIGAETAVNLRYDSRTAVDTESKIETTNKKEEVVNMHIVKEYAEKYKDDPSYAPLDWINTYEQ